TLKVRLVNAYLPHLHAAAAVDSRVGAAFMRVSNLLDPPPRLLSPTLVLRVLRTNLHRRRDRPSPRLSGHTASSEAATRTRPLSRGSPNAGAAQRE
ncbi:MAG: hypothetical protein QOK27_647, partial [Gemmatimonadales bacterium]|nr:hypothetical protein [Gemmatimonadales bacterium]